MTAAQKALDALEAANAERTQGVWFAVDVTGRKEPNDGIWIGGTSAWAVYSNAKNRARHSRDAKATALSVNLAAPLAAVVRAVADRPWWQRYAEGHRYFANCTACGSEMKRAGDPWTHEVGCRHAPADAALDAFAVAAQEMFP